MNLIEPPLWNRGDTKFSWNGSQLEAPGPIIWIAELPGKVGLAVVTLFDENTPSNETNAFVYHPNSKFGSIKVLEEGKAVKFLGCYTEGENIVFNAANEMEYVFNPSTFEVLTCRYYR
jgi:hypothetical protein